MDANDILAQLTEARRLKQEILSALHKLMIDNVAGKTVEQTELKVCIDAWVDIFGSPL